MHRANLAGILFCAGLIAGCSGTQITKTDWTPSPDGHWLTQTTRYDTAGPGTNSLYESVQLKRRASNKAVDVFTLDEGEATGKELATGSVIRLVWRDPNHLEISHRAGKVLHGISRIAELSIRISE